MMNFDISQLFKGIIFMVNSENPNIPKTHEKNFLSVASKVKTPLALSGLVVIVLSITYKLILSLDIFDKVGSEGTIVLISSLIDKVFFLAVIAVLFGLLVHVITLLLQKQQANQSKHNGGKPNDGDITTTNGALNIEHRECCRRIAESYSKRIEKWFDSRFQALQSFTTFQELKSNSKPDHSKILPLISKDIDGFPGGIYTLDNLGTVIHQYTPAFPDMADITGYQAGHKEYFIECQRQQKPIVSNTFTSANRREEILVVAVPRYNNEGKFIGILDAVVDICSAPFSEIASEVIDFFKSKFSFIENIRIVLLDNRSVVLGSNHHEKVSTGLGGDPVIDKALFAKTKRVSSDDDCYWCSVKGTPFVVVAYWL